MNDSKTRGFTLIEVLIALFILIVALLGTLGVTATVIKGNSFEKMQTDAATLAQEKIEELKIAGTAASSGSDNPQSVYTRQWTVTGNTPASGMSEVTVTVSFTWASKSRTVTVRTII
ncbi:MAG: prepilin-type N-terminal cleavage/methylation domain-containing protein [Syntrophales bacterium]|jgi:prepilin-type N-terminal cleavage/methylation domain-containing protein|nr:prepilin-type N-terminal cleavage/methylation domain-containing protein [Syntrophales bacterium]MDY0044592.1 prepilin-type N-terminal cleavage/methylation domain-containing protein [Syntrophales bacterium]